MVLAHFNTSQSERNLWKVCLENRVASKSIQRWQNKHQKRTISWSPEISYDVFFPNRPTLHHLSRRRSMVGFRGFHLIAILSHCGNSWSTRFCSSTYFLLGYSDTTHTPNCCYKSFQTHHRIHPLDTRQRYTCDETYGAVSSEPLQLHVYFINYSCSGGRG